VRRKKKKKEEREGAAAMEGHKGQELVSHGSKSGKKKKGRDGKEE